MNKQIINVFLLVFFIFCKNITAQGEQTTKTLKLFRSEEILPLKLNFSIKDVKKKTNDTTFIKSSISYKTKEGHWNELGVGLRSRGHFRLENCYFPPIKIKIKKSVAKETLFKGNKKLKLVLPCSPNNSNANNYVVREFMAYKLYEIISPYYFNTRLVDITLEEIKGKKLKTFQLKGFLIEDDKKIAKRYGGKVVKRDIHPLNLEPVNSVRNAFFQFLIGNTDFSTAYSHNEKLFFIDTNIIPIPYDFDMSGLVNTNYAIVSTTNKKNLKINSVRDRLYRGFKRDMVIIQQVRKEFLNNQGKLLQEVDKLKPYFSSVDAFMETRAYILSFFDVMKDNGKFEKEIINNLRNK